jgi:cell wall-associated NlpC family hydrolase
LAQNELRPGDLVFFNTLNRPFSHVGIYLGDDRFVHASSSRTGSVMVSNLNDRYWRERFDGARRVVSPGTTPAAVATFE